MSQCRDAFLVSTERSITEEGLANSSTQIIPALSTVVVARGATTGRLTMFGADMAMNQTCYALRSKHDTPFFLFMCVRHEISAMVHAAHGSVFNTITTASFKAHRVLLPPPLLCKAFDQSVEPIFRLILSNLRESAILAALSGLLLPKLLSGELRLGAHAKVATAVA